MMYFHIFAILVIWFVFLHDLVLISTISEKKFLLPAILGILLFQTLSHIHSRLDIFNPTILRDETLTITVVLLLKWNCLVLFLQRNRVS